MSLSKLIEAVERGENFRYALAAGDIQLPPHIAHHLGDDAEAARDGSLDAAKRLHDALLPGWEWLVRLRGGYACVYEPEEMGDEDAEAIIIGMPARAWLLAILRALEGKEGGE